MEGSSTAVQDRSCSALVAQTKATIRPAEKTDNSILLNRQEFNRILQRFAVTAQTFGIDGIDADMRKESIPAELFFQHHQINRSMKQVNLENENNEPC